MKLAIIYPEKFPSKFARSISIINTAAALSNKIDTTLLYEESSTKTEIENFYKISLKHLNLLPISKKYLISSNKIFNFNLKRVMNNFDIFYVRHLKQAKFLIEQNKKIIYECHEIFSDENPKMEEIEKFVLKNSIGIVFNNKTLQKIVNNKFILSEEQTIIYNGHGFSTEFTEKDFSKIDQLTYIGSLIPWKGVEFLIKCINQTDYKLNIIGEGKSKNYLKTISNQNIKFFDFQNKKEIARILSDSKISIIPNINSRYNLFSTPIKLFEYMAFSNIIIAPDFEPIKEIIIDQENGFLFEPENCNDFLNKLDCILHLSPDKLKKISKNAYLTSQNFTWDKRAKKIIHFIKEIQ